MPVTLAANALTTLAAVKDALSVTDSAFDDRITRLINGASDSIGKYCGGRIFGRVVDRVERVAGYGTELIHLEVTPVESITSIVVREQTLDPSEYAIRDPETGSIWRDGAWPWTAPLELSASPHRAAGLEERAIVVTYTGGYALAGVSRTPGTYPQPYDLEEACISLAVYRYRKLGKDPSMYSESIGRTSRAFSGKLEGALDIPPYIAGTIDQYLRVR